MVHEKSIRFTNKSNKSNKSNKRLGAFGEQAVVENLLVNNYEVIDRNWRIKEGEIDIVARKSDGVIVFVEVKTRSSAVFGHPLESITRAKAHRLQKLALAWLAMHGLFGRPFAIDCAAVLLTSDGQPTIEYRAHVL